MPDSRDFEELADLLADPQSWNEAQAAHARLLRDNQARAAAAYDQRDRKRVASMHKVVEELVRAIAAYEASR